MRKVILTFDTEDFISNSSIQCLDLILDRLKKYELNALFFISAHMAEKLVNFPTLVDKLMAHEIGYHSSSHSVYPRIFEFTDVENYDLAYKESIIRETSHIDPITGEIQGRGGIYALQDLWPQKKIKSFRAPGLCWSPPHIEALRTLGISFDFSANISPEPVFHKGVTFYPYPSFQFWRWNRYFIRLFLRGLFRQPVVVALFHPDLFINQVNWDSIYWKSPPKKLLPAPKLDYCKFKTLFRSFDLFFKRIRHIEKMRFLDLKPNLVQSQKTINLTKVNVQMVYERSVNWAKQYYSYEPKYLENHFLTFFS